MSDQLLSLLMCRYRKKYYLFGEKFSYSNGGRPRPGRRITNSETGMPPKEQEPKEQEQPEEDVDDKQNSRKASCRRRVYGLVAVPPSPSRCHLCPTTNQLWSCRVVGVSWRWMRPGIYPHAHPAGFSKLADTSIYMPSSAPFFFPSLLV